MGAPRGKLAAQVAGFAMVAPLWLSTQPTSESKPTPISYGR
jgi:hypothetical protein